VNRSVAVSVVVMTLRLKGGTADGKATATDFQR
jgi:hypothetical protein